jgi:hypothetical protein
MKVELRLDANGVARVWIDESSGGEYSPARTVSKLVPSAESYPRASRAAIELRMLRGSRRVYGLLGASFVANAQDMVTVRVGSVPIDRRDTWEGIQGSREQAYRGLPDEYVPWIIDGAIHGIQTYPLHGGELSFAAGCHGIIGSYPRLFRALARVVIGLLVVGPDLPDVLAELVRKELAAGEAYVPSDDLERPAAED